jgi:hypothetical protein
MRRILGLGEARGYEPATSQTRWLFTNLACWFESIENVVHAARQAREGLIAGGELAYAGYTYSSVRYATPQERYLLGKLGKLEKIVMLDIVEEHNVDKTLERYSHANIKFPRPKSFI